MVCIKIVCMTGRRCIHINVTQHRYRAIKYCLIYLHRYLYQCLGESTKNHQDDSENITGRIYEVINTSASHLCPVKTYETYISKLDPSCDVLFQTPKMMHHVSDKVYYIPHCNYSSK